MADLYELQLALHLPGSFAPDDLALLRWHLGMEGGRQGGGYAYPLWDARGAALRIGGALVGELHSGGGAGWALTVRQETHPDHFDALRRIVLWLGARTTTVGTVGHLRFYEEDVPDVLIAESGAVRREVLRVDRTVGTADHVIPDFYA
ncbi:hypothetical protein BU52_02240 [Streptomyces toyocaensis]|uniref:Uncharacterized protein n=1 Tax=Streptomyces toyocaensis TaxID=55952 RepID=A0A081XZB7_STRTO|nr:hypothetical protein [Streptomyces toyocaensis]KES08890.1 hypothetical protein BU52_02240 [Streptomyces toyocaensis]